MFIGSTRESQDKQAQMEVEARREAAAAFPFIRPVLQRFNGKVYNCRFEKALKEAAEGKTPGRVYARKDGYWVTVNYYPSMGNPGHCIYGLTLCQMKTEALIDGKRLDGKALDDSLKERRAALLREAAEIEEQAQQVELYRKRIEETKRLLESVTGGINRTIRDIYGLDYYVSRH